MNGFANKATANGIFSKNSNGQSNGQVSGQGQKPLSHAYFGLGEGKGIKATVWPNSITLERTEKKDGQWQTTQEFHLAFNVLKEISWRSTHWLQQMNNERENEKKKAV